MARKRRAGFREQKSNILIVCEGETEQIYLNKLKSLYRLPTVTINVVNVKGGSAMKVYEMAEKNVSYKKRGAEKIEKVFCVFDNDAKNIDTELMPALNSMNKENYIPIYSNFSFELWLYLHHAEPKAFTSEKNLLDALKRIDKKYSKTKYDVDSYIKQIDTAKSRSEKLVSKCSGDFPKIKSDIQKNPYTNMCCLLNILENEKNK